MTPSFAKASSLPQALGAGGLIVGSVLVAYASLCLGGELPWHEQVAAGPATADLMEAGAKVNRWVATGQWYRLATSPLLHGDLIHLLANEVPEEQRGPGSYMVEALAYRDQWRSRLLRTSAWSPLY